VVLCEGEEGWDPRQELEVREGQGQGDDFGGQQENPSHLIDSEAIEQVLLGAITCDQSCAWAAGGEDKGAAHRG